jgi:ATP-dependent helicase HrpB
VSFSYLHSDLPIIDIIPQVKQHLGEQNTLIVNAPPGAGKSTLLPLTLLDEPWLAGKKIIMLEPRRLAAKTIAARMAQLWGDEPGQTIGYRIRFENRVSAHTRLEVVTEGILTRMLHSDNALEGVGLVIFDEFHERSIHADVALALCREAQQILRPDLRDYGDVGHVEHAATYRLAQSSGSCE